MGAKTNQKSTPKWFQVGMHLDIDFGSNVVDLGTPVGTQNHQKMIQNRTNTFQALGRTWRDPRGTVQRNEWESLKINEMCAEDTSCADDTSVSALASKMNTKLPFPNSRVFVKNTNCVPSTVVWRTRVVANKHAQLLRGSAGTKGRMLRFPCRGASTEI